MWKRWYRNLRHRQVIEKDLNDELRAYVEEMSARRVASGMDPAAARRAVLVELGGLSTLEERVREERVGFTFETSVWKPFLMSLRRLWRDPAFTVTAVLTLAFAIGANTAIFTIADHILFRPMPYSDPDRLQVLQGFTPQKGTRYLNVPVEQLEILAQHHKGMSRFATFGTTDNTLSDSGGYTEAIRTAEVSPNYFEVLGVRAYRGRLFDQRDAQGRGIVLTYAAWVKRFSANDDVIGKEVPFGNQRFDLLGVLPPDFVFSNPSFFGGNAEIVRVERPLPPGAIRGGFIHPVVRLKPGVSREQAQAEIRSIMAGTNSDSYPVLDDIKESVFPRANKAIVYLTSAAILVLLTGCANLAIMLLVRGQRSLRETGVRGALGASRVQLALPLMFESVIVGIAGGGLALATTAAAFGWLRAMVPPRYYEGAPIGVDLRVALFALGLGLLGGIVFAGVPAWRSARVDVQALLHGREETVLRRGRLGGSLIAAQVALSVMLVAGAISATRSFVSIVNQPLGFDPTNVITVDVRIRAQGAERHATYVNALDRLSKLPGVISAGASFQLPLATNVPWGGFILDGARVNGAGSVPVLPGFFEATGMQLTRGRFLDGRDLRERTGAAVMGAAAAKAVFGESNPLGRTLEGTKGERYTVVGVVAETPRVADPAVYIVSDGSAFMFFAIRTRERRDALLQLVRKEVNAAIPGVPATVVWWDETLDALPRTSDPRFQTLVLGSFGVLALGLTGLGVFAVVAFSVAVRMKEMGIRMAVGAEARGLVALMLRQTLAPVVGGLAVGVVLTGWAGKIAEASWGVPMSAGFEWTGLAAGTVAVAALFAALVPARRAATVDPMIVLRCD